MNITAKDICKKAITVEATKMMSDVRDIMLKHDISRVIVENNKKPIGMVTEKGISRFLYNEINYKSLDQIAISKAMGMSLTSVAPDASIKDCARLMLDNDISSLIVHGEGLEGDGGGGGEDEIRIFTKSDLVKLYAENCRGKYKVEDYMTNQLLTTLPSNSLHTVLKILMKERVSRVIVTAEDGNKIMGIMTAKDLMPITTFVEGERLGQGKMTGKGREGEDEGGYMGDLAAIGHTMIARDIMQKPITVEAYDDLANAAKIMAEKRISGLPVIDSNSGDLVGVITKTDIVKALRSTL
jgi:CBS domain-containing protein